MSERLIQQLEEMEQQLSALEGAIVSIQEAKTASLESVQSLKDVRDQLAESFEKLLPELRDRFDAFSEDSRNILERTSSLLDRFEKLDADKLALLLMSNKEELGEQTRSLMETHVLQMKQLYAECSAGSITETQQALEAQHEKLAESLEAQDRKMSSAFDACLEEQKKSMDEFAESTKLANVERFEKLEEKLVELQGQNVEVAKTIEMESSQIQAAIKQVKIFCIISVLAGIAAVISSIATMGF